MSVSKDGKTRTVTQFPDTQPPGAQPQVIVWDKHWASLRHRRSEPESAQSSSGKGGPQNRSVRIQLSFSRSFKVTWRSEWPRITSA